LIAKYFTFLSVFYHENGDAEDNVKVTQAKIFAPSLSFGNDLT
jgi:hypothetical protein